jgi:hypothetical protein
MRPFALLLVLLPLPAAAACPNDTEIFSCTITGKPLQICHWKGALIYNFGPLDAPELSIAEPLETVAFTPWPGAGNYIWETVVFRNEGFTYEVWTSIERGPDATTGLEAAVTVFEGEAEIARLDCDKGTPTNSLDRIYDLKQSIGQCWDYDTRTWATTCD